MWYYGITKKCEGNLNLFSRHLRRCGPLHFAFRAMWHMHAPIFNKWDKKKKTKKNKNKKVALHMLTHGVMWGCGLTSLVVCIDDICDIRKRNVTIRSEIWTIKIRSLGFRNIRECVTLWRLILRSLGCIETIFIWSMILRSNHGLTILKI